MYHGLTERSGREAGPPRAVVAFFPSSSFSLRRLFKPSAATGRRLARFRFQRETSNRDDRRGRSLGGERGKFQAGLHSLVHTVPTKPRYLRKTGTKRPALCQLGAD